MMENLLWKIAAWLYFSYFTKNVFLFQKSNGRGWVPTIGTSSSSVIERCDTGSIHQWTEFKWSRGWSWWSLQRFVIIKNLKNSPLQRWSQKIGSIFRRYFKWLKMKKHLFRRRKSIRETFLKNQAFFNALCFNFPFSWIPFMCCFLYFLWKKRKKPNVSSMVIGAILFIYYVYSQI